MKQFYISMLALACLGTTKVNSQTGPNLLGAKGTFSAPFVTPNTNAAACTQNGTASYSPLNNIGNPLSTLSGAGTAQPASGYTYVSGNNGLQPEFTYTLIKNIGDANGGNCIKGDWRGQNHTPDDGWFMAVNGSPNANKSKIFYKIDAMTVCPGTKYEFSAWVINLLPKTSSSAKPGSEPNISFRIISGNDTSLIANSGPVAYNNNPQWVKVSGTFTAPVTASVVTLEVVNATTVASGNDFGLDDISFNVVESNINVTDMDGNAPATTLCEGGSTQVKFTVTDPNQTNSWYQWQVSTDGGANFRDTLAAAQATFSGSSYTLTLNLQNVTSEMNGTKYRLKVSTSLAGLSSPDCSDINEYTLIVTACGPMPVTLTSFNGKYANGVAQLDWQTTMEMNNDHFELYRSYDGQQFSLVGTVKGAGYSNTIRNYSYSDNMVGSGQYVYYRLKQVDSDGKFSYSNIVKISIANFQAKMEVYPNPFSSQFNVSFSANKSADATLIIRNSMGQPVVKKIVKTNQGNNSLTINNIPSLAPGVYYISITNDDINYNSKLQKQ